MGVDLARLVDHLLEEVCLSVVSVETGLRATALLLRFSVAWGGLVHVVQGLDVFAESVVEGCSYARCVRHWFPAGVGALRGWEERLKFPSGRCDDVLFGSPFSDTRGIVYGDVEPFVVDPEFLVLRSGDFKGV